MLQTDGNVFLVVEPDPTVARDLEESLRALDPGATVRLAVAGAQAREALGQLDRLTAAFLRLPHEELRSAEIPAAVEARGGRVVVLDVRPAGTVEGRGPGWVYTGRPFGEGAVSRALGQLGLLGP